MYCKQEILSQIELFDEKQAQRLQLSSIIRAIGKLEEKEIHDSELEKKFLILKELLEKTKDDYKGNKNAVSKAHNELTEYLRKEHGLIAKGYYSSTYMAIGLAIGTAVGVALMNTVNTAFFAIGIGSGLAIGLGLGASMEKKAEEQGVLY